MAMSVPPLKFAQPSRVILCTFCNTPATPDTSITPCDHTFHKACLIKYVESQSNTYICSLCNKSILKSYQELTDKSDSYFEQNQFCTLCLKKPKESAYQFLACGHFFCFQCFTENCTNQMIFNENLVRCKNCGLNEMKPVVKIKLNCRCVHDTQDLKARILALTNKRMVNSGNSFPICPKCKKWPLKEEELILLFGNAKYREARLNQAQYIENAPPSKESYGNQKSERMTLNRTNPSFYRSAKDWSMAQPDKAEIYTKDVCKKCNIKSFGVFRHQCTCSFLCRTCIKCSIDNASKDNTHFRLELQCLCKKLINPLFLEEIELLMESLKDTFYERSYQEWKNINLK
jgi:hypothetical protein